MKEINVNKDFIAKYQGQRFDKAPKIAVPVWVAKILGNFNKQLKVASPFLGRVRVLLKQPKQRNSWLETKII